MLDKRTAKLLDSILAVCADGSYKIIESADLSKSMLPRYNTDHQALEQIIKFLSDDGMVDVKYSDDKVFCIAVLPKGRVHAESRMAQKRELVVGKRLMIVTIVASFIGAMVGAVLAHLLL